MNFQHEKATEQVTDTVNKAVAYCFGLMGMEIMGNAQDVEEGWMTMRRVTCSTSGHTCA